MRSPNWHRDEIILALDLYRKIPHGKINKANPEVIALSDLLNRLPIHPHAGIEKFRNANGVAMKLSNFLALDPGYPGTGLQSASKLDKAVFNEFSNDRETMEKLATAIRSTANDERLTEALRTVANEEEDDIGSVKEGRVLYKLHKYRERNSKIVKQKKEQYLKAHDKLDCEVCGFDFQQVYGELGEGFIECHHRKPLAKLDAETETTAEDLALVCSNCHRMLHRRLASMSIADLKELIYFHVAKH